MGEGISQLRSSTQCDVCNTVTGHMVNQDHGDSVLLMRQWPSRHQWFITSTWEQKMLQNLLILTRQKRWVEWLTGGKDSWAMLVVRTEVLRVP